MPGWLQLYYRWFDLHGVSFRMLMNLILKSCHFHIEIVWAEVSK